jgi:hypothetical protein
MILDRLTVSIDADTPADDIVEALVEGLLTDGRGVSAR